MPPGSAPRPSSAGWKPRLPPTRRPIGSRCSGRTPSWRGIEREEQLDREHAAAEAQVDREFARRREAASDQARHDQNLITDEEQAVAEAHVDGVLDVAAIAQEARQAEAAAEALKDAQRELEHQKNGD